MQYLLHPDIPADFIEYLLAAGYQYQKSVEKKGLYAATFTRDEYVLEFAVCRVRIAQLVKSVRSENQLVKKEITFEGLDVIDFYGWAQLLDLSGALPLAEIFSQLTRKELGPVLATIARRLQWPTPGPDMDLAPTLERQLSF